MSRAMNGLTTSSRSGNSGCSEIARLVRLMDEFFRIAETADEGSLEAKSSGRDEGKLLAGTLSNLQEEADERASAIATAIGALEPETLDDALALLVIAYSDLETWLANFLPERPKQCASPADEVVRCGGRAWQRAHQAHDRGCDPRGEGERRSSAEAC